jgi:hypothetical protein
MLEIEGTGLLTVNVTGAEVPPPGADVNTVIDNKVPVARSDAGIAAVSWVLLIKVVVRFAPLTRTTEPLMKLLPVTVNVSPELPALALLGEMLAKDGTGLVTVRVAADEVPPPGAALLTLMETVPGDAMSLAEIVAVSCVLLTNVVGRPDPFTSTTEPLTKLPPFTVRVKAGPPATLVLGETPPSDGTGLFTVKVKAPLVPPPDKGVFTATDRNPAATRSEAGSVAVNSVLLTKVVLRFAPLTWTVDALTKFVPVAVSVTGPLPANAEAGEIAVSVGLMGVIVRLKGFEFQPPPSEFATVNACCPAWARSLLLSW